MGHVQRVLWTEPLILCGFGQVGSAAARAASLAGRHPHRITVVESNRERARSAARSGYRVVMGDAATSEALASAGAGVARSIIICIGDSQAAAATKIARDLSPGATIHVVLETQDHEEQAVAAGADGVLPLSRICGILLADAALSEGTGRTVQEAG